MKKSAEIGHEPKPHVFDQGVPGRYNSSHAEKQASVVAPNQPIGVSNPMCSDCVDYFQKLAKATGHPQVVADPNVTRVFMPDGRIIYDYPIPNPTLH
jgi:hypothetical protein